MSKYTIEYRYDNYEEGCGCCSYSEQTLTVYDAATGEIEFQTDNVGAWAENESELCMYVNGKYPEYSDFTVHDECRWF